MYRSRVNPCKWNAAKKPRTFLAHRWLLVLTWPILLINVQLAWSENLTTSSSWFVDMNRFSKSAHGSLKCERCHGELTSQPNVHPNRKDVDAMKKDTVASYDYKRCEACHPEAYQRYLTGEHAKVLIKQEQDKRSGIKEASLERLAPRCGDCHSSHYAPSKLSRIEIGAREIETCGKCHKAQVMSYLKDSHGRMSVFLEEKASACCTDCHGAHACESLKDQQKALIACRRCHRDATIGFAGVIIHAGSEDISKKDPKKQADMEVIGAVKRISQIGVIVILAFFALQTLVWILRELHNKLRGR